MFIHWDKSMETGQTLIDVEHRLLVFQFRRLDMAVKMSQSQTTLNTIIHEIKQFVEFHFVSEENLMRETNYPQLLTHHALHSALVGELRVLSAKVVAHQEFPEDFLFFLNEWLLKHIAGHDQHVAHHAGDAAMRPIGEQAYGEYIDVIHR